LSKAWYEIVNSGNPDHLKAGTNIESVRRGRAGVASYCLKYAKKEEQKVPPKGAKDIGRFWGVFGNRDMSATTLSYTLDESPYKDYVKGVIAKVEDVFAMECKSKDPLYIVNDWKIPCGKSEIVGETWQIKHPKLVAAMIKLIEEIKADAKSNNIPAEPKFYPVFHSMRRCPNSRELSRRYGQLQERNYRLRCKEVRIRGNCATDQRPDNPGRRADEARRDKKFRLETWAVNKYRERMGNEHMVVL